MMDVVGLPERTMPYPHELDGGSDSELALRVH